FDVLIKPILFMKNHILKLFFSALFLAGISFVSAQEVKHIEGNVIDENGVPLPGVNVLIKGTTTGTQTDFDGHYSLEVSENDVIVFSYLGTKTIELAVGEAPDFNIRMQADHSELDEVVVVGYGAVKKSDLTGAISSVSADELASVPAMNAVQALQGKIGRAHV